MTAHPYGPVVFFTSTRIPPYSMFCVSQFRELSPNFPPCQHMLVYVAGQSAADRDVHRLDLQQQQPKTRGGKSLREHIGPFWLVRTATNDGCLCGIVFGEAHVSHCVIFVVLLFLVVAI